MNQISTICFTVIGGVSVFVLGQITIKFLIEPVQELRRLIAEIAFTLDFYANQIHLSGPKTLEAQELYRKQACRPRELLNLIFLYGCASALRVLPPKQNVERASGFLIGLSNECGRPPEGRGRASEIKELLKITPI